MDPSELDASGRVSGGRPTDEQQVLAAAAELVRHFGAHDTEAYFADLAPDATFVFHSHPDVIGSRAAYRQVWDEWAADGFRVLGCRSEEPRAQLVGPDVAVFVHRVRTTLDGVQDEQRERETIVFRREPDGRWLGVHEHLSVDPLP